MRLRLAVDLGPFTGPLAPYIWGSIGFHVIAFIATVWFGAWERPAQLLPAMPVTLLGADPIAEAPAQASAPAPTPPAPEPEPQVETPSVAEDVEPIEKPREDPPPQPRPDPKPPAPRPQRNPTPSGPVGDAEATEFKGSAGSQVGVQGLEGSDFDWYSGRLLNALYLSWQKPSLAGFSEPLDAKIGFTVHPDGRVSDVRVVTTSGERSLDRSGMRAVADAILPPFPPSVRKSGPKDVSVIFRLLPE